MWRILSFIICFSGLVIIEVYFGTYNSLSEVLQTMILAYIIAYTLVLFSISFITWPLSILQCYDSSYPMFKSLFALPSIYEDLKQL